MPGLNLPFSVSQSVHQNKTFSEAVIKARNLQYKQYMIDKNMAPQEDGVATATAPSHEGGTGKSTLGQPQLSKQDLATLDISKLTPLSPEVISRQVN